MKKLFIFLTLIFSFSNINAQTSIEIQTLIDDAVAGDVVQIPAGTYVLDATISIDKDVTLECGTIDGCIIDATGV